MLNITIRDLEIQHKEDKNKVMYFVIIDKSTNEAYFCFSRRMKEAFDVLALNWREIRQISLEYEQTAKGKRVNTLKILTE